MADHASKKLGLYVALLRGINVGGRNLVAMADLRALFESLGFTDVRSLLQSGNLVFQSDGRTSAKLEALLATETEQRLGVAVDYFVRSSADWQAIVASNPFPAEAERDPSHLLVMCQKEAPALAAIETLRAAIRGPELVAAVGKQVYLVYPAGIGTSKLTGAVIEKKLGGRGTGRNWNTVLKLAAMLGV